MTARAWFFAVVAVAGPALGLHFASGDRPFVGPRLLVVQFVAALPLAFLLAATLNRLPWAQREVGQLTPRLFLAASTTGLGVWFAPMMARLLGETGFVAHAVARSMLATALVGPWLFAGQIPGDMNFRPTGRHFAIGLLIALLPPTVYADRLRDVRVQSFEGYASTGRLVRARGLLDGLTDLGVDRVHSKPLAAWRKELDRDIAALADAVRRPPSIDGHVAHGFALIQLDRLNDAERILRPLAESNADAALILVALFRDEARWPDAVAMSEQSVELLGLDAPEATRALAHEGWFEAAHAAGDRVAAHRVLTEAIERLPSRAGHFHWLFGRYYFDVGQPARAREHLDEATRLDPSIASEANTLRNAIRRSTPACFGP